MGPNIHNSDNLEQSNVLEGQLRECFGRVVYSHKVHEKWADILLAHLTHIKWCQIILSAITAGGCITVFFGAGNAGVAVGAVVSTLLLIVNAFTKENDLSELAQRARHAAADLWIIREKYLSLLTDLRMRNRALEDLLLERDRLLQELHGVYSGAPSTNNRAYRKAQKALKVWNDMTFSDNEIDAFLPREIRKLRDTS